MDNINKIVAKVTTSFVIDGKPVISYQIAVHSNRGLKVFKTTKGVYDTLRLNTPCSIFFDEYGRIANITY